MPGSGDGMSGSEQLKRRRITRACDRCHRSGVKCSASTTPGVCGPCAAFGSECTYNRPVKRRGPVPRGVSAKNGSTDDSPQTPLSAAWRYEAVASDDVIEQLVDAYHHLIFPMLPYFHWPTFQAHIKLRRYAHDRAFYAATMAVCAIACARLRDGAGYVHAIFPEAALAFPADSPPPPSETFYDAAVRTVPSDLSQAPEFDYKRAKIILAMLCVQYGQVRQVTTHLGDYITLCSIDSFHLENRWPPNLPQTEIQERRRVFWGAYTIDVYAATTWGGIVRHREAQSTVLYPAEIDDEDITEHGIVPRANSSTRRPSFLVGWNFTNDLYRILEHSLEQLRQKRNLSDSSSVQITEFYASRSSRSPQEGLDLVAQLYASLPPEFKGAKAMEGDMSEDRYGFQAADIIVTMQTVKMVMLGLEDATVEKRCAVAGELLDALATVPTAYLQAISSPILNQLAGVGHLLGSVIQSPLSPWCYLQVRQVLLAMADLVGNLEQGMTSVQGIADKLRDHVLRIDQYMTAAAQDRSRRSHVFHSTLPPSSGWPNHTQAPGTLDHSANHNRPSGPAGPAPTPAPAPPRHTHHLSPMSSNVRASPHASLSPISPEAAVPNSGVPAGSASWNASPGFIGTTSTSTDEAAGVPSDPFEFPFSSLPPGEQVQLPDDLWFDFPLEIGQAFDFLGAMQPNV